METTANVATKETAKGFKAGSFRDSIRAYRKYKREWLKEMDIKLAQVEEKIRQAKTDPYLEKD